MLRSSPSTARPSQIKRRTTAWRIKLLSVLLFMVLGHFAKAQNQAQALTARDSVLLQLIDSLETQRKTQLEAERKVQMARGYWPAGLVNLELGRLFNYNHFEGIKPGLGLETSRFLSTRFTLTGFYSYSIRSRDHSYGGSYTHHLSGNLLTAWQIFAHRDQYETGSFTFLDGEIADERFRKFAVGTVDRTEALGGQLKLRPGRYGKIALHYSYRHLSPIAPYLFSLRAVTSPSTFKEHLFGLYWRWQRKIPWLPGLTPTLCTNLRHGREAEDTQGNYWQAEAQADWLFEPGGRFKSSLRLNAAQIWKAPSLTHLYSAFGTRSNPMALESRHSMATMRPNEFAATRFFQAFLRQSITLHSNKQSCFQPVLTISTSALWGTLHTDWKALAKSVEKGYFESGLYFEDRFRMASIGYGLAVHYRYGPYQMDSQIDNWSFRLGLNFHL